MGNTVPEGFQAHHREYRRFLASSRQRIAAMGGHATRADTHFRETFPNYTPDSGGEIIGRQVDPEQIGRHVVDPPEYLRDLHMNDEQTNQGEQ